MKKYFLAVYFLLLCLVSMPLCSIAQANNGNNIHILPKMQQNYNDWQGSKISKFFVATNVNKKGGVSVKSITQAQDYNSSRSNKYSAFSLLVTLNKQGAINVNSIAQAQDYNSSRSNKANGFILVVNQNNNTSDMLSSVLGDLDYNNTRSNKTYGIATAQDYNSTRSNKANCFTIYLGDNDGVGDMHIKAISAAQDYNSTRSNKANCFNLVINIDDAGGVKVNAIATGYGYNSTRSNKANCFTLVVNKPIGDMMSAKLAAQDYNSSRSNKANGIGKNPLYNDGGKERVNPLYEGKNGLANTNNPTQTASPNAYASAQDYNSSRSNKGYSVAPFANTPRFVLSGGVVWGNSADFMSKGFAINAGYVYPIKYGWGIDIGAGFMSNDFSYQPATAFPEKIRTALKQQINPKEDWQHVFVGLGPSYSLGFGKFSADISIKAGIFYTLIPDQTLGNNEDTATSFSDNKISFALLPGLRFNYIINDNFSVFISPSFYTTVGKNIPYQERDAAKAVDEKGNFNMDKFLSLPLAEKKVGIESWGVNVGMSIGF